MNIELPAADSSTPTADAPTGAVRAWLELVRIPNVFTALADVMMGYFVTHPDLTTIEHPLPFALLLLASAAVYSAGMVLNDVYDAPVDANERPRRPIPSGRISPAGARSAGFGLLGIGLALGWAVSFLSGGIATGLVATGLAACVWLYDVLLKRTPIAPLVMGSCRTLNVLLGMSVAEKTLAAHHFVIAAGIGVYIAGVTWFARTEAHESKRLLLIWGLIVMLLGIGLLASFPSWDEAFQWAQLRVPRSRWNTFWGMLGFLVCWRGLRAVLDPEASVVQAAVKQCILSLIILDAAVCYAFQGLNGPAVLNGAVLPWTIMILLLLAPTMALGRWIYST